MKAKIKPKSSTIQVFFVPIHIASKHRRMLGQAYIHSVAVAPHLCRHKTMKCILMLELVVWRIKKIQSYMHMPHELTILRIGVSRVCCSCLFIHFGTCECEQFWKSKNKNKNTHINKQSYIFRAVFLTKSRLYVDWNVNGQINVHSLLFFMLYQKLATKKRECWVLQCNHIWQLSMQLFQSKWKFEANIRINMENKV